MDSAVFLTVIEAALTPLVTEGGGVITVASDPDHVLEILAGSAPNGWRLILNWAGEDGVDPINAQGIADMSLAATIQCARGLKLDSGAWAYKPNAAGRDPLLTLSKRVSQWIRGLSGTHPDLSDMGFRFHSSAWLSIENLPTRQITTTHKITMALDKPIDTPCIFPS